jgi:hypothetical protein
MVMSRHQKAGQNHTLLVAHKSFENMAKFKHWKSSNIKTAFTNKLRAD